MYIVSHESRSVLGFHEDIQKNQELVLKLDHLKRIYPEGFFELKILPRQELNPYLLKISYKMEMKIRFDPCYFTIQFTELGQFLFAEGRITIDSNTNLVDILKKWFVWDTVLSLGTHSKGCKYY